MKTQPMKISDINVGDHVVAYSTVFEVTAKHRSVAHDEIRSHLPDIPVYCLSTKVIDGSKSILPEHWMNTWVIQSNDRDTHSVVTS